MSEKKWISAYIPVYLFEWFEGYCKKNDVSKSKKLKQLIESLKETKNGKKNNK